MRKGFTLLELLIVIIIIGLLAAIGIVQYGNAVVRAANSEARTTLGEMRKAAMAYYSLNNAYPSAIGSLASIDLDGDGTSDVSFTPPTGGSYAYTCNATTGIATSSGSGADWTITFSSGAMSSS